MSRLQVLLLAHGDMAARESLSAQVERRGTTVQATANGVQAIEIARLSQPQLACVGAHVEGMRPLDLCKALSNKGIPVLFLGGDGVNREEALRAGAVDYLPLPAFAEDVASASQLLGARHREPGGDWIVRAKLSEFGLYPLVRALCGLSRSAIVTVERGERSGELRLYEGEVTSAQIGSLTGIAAFHQLLLWQEAVLEVRFAPVLRRQQIGLSREELLAEGERFLRDFRHAAGQVGSTEAVYEQDLKRVAEVVQHIPSDVSGLVRLFDGDRTVADVIQDSPFRPFDTIRVCARLVEMGALQLRSGVAPARLPKKKKATPPAPVPAVEEWLSKPPSRPPGTAPKAPPPADEPAATAPTRSKRTRPAASAAASADARPPAGAAGRTQPEPPMTLRPKKRERRKAAPEAEVSLERRIEEALARQSAPRPPAPAVDRPGMEALLSKQAGALFGQTPPAAPPAPPAAGPAMVATPIPPVPPPPSAVATPIPALAPAAGAVATPVEALAPRVATPPPPAADLVVTLPPPPLRPAPEPSEPPVVVLPPPPPQAPVSPRAEPAEPPVVTMPPPPAAPEPAFAQPVWPPALAAPPPPVAPVWPPVPAAPLTAPPIAQPTPPPPAQPAAPPIAAAPPLSPAPLPTPPVTRPPAARTPAKSGAADMHFTDLEEDFFSKVDEHGNLPPEVDTFEDLEPGHPGDLKRRS